MTSIAAISPSAGAAVYVRIPGARLVAGCGFFGGGMPAYLPNLDLTVWMPDCARYRANGKTEIKGFEPDIKID